MICPSAREAIKTPEWSCPDTQVLGPTPPSTQSLPMPHVPFTKSALATALAYSVPGHQNLDFSCHTVAMSEHYTWPLLLENWCCFFFFWRNASYFPYLLTPSLPKPQGLPVSSRRAPLNPPTPPARWGLQHQAPIASVPTSSISLHTLHWSPLLLQFPIRLWAL